MAEEKNKLESSLDTALKYIGTVGDIYAKTALAKKGVAQPVVYQTAGANDPSIVVGQPANVTSSGGVMIADAINNFGNKAAAVGAVSEVRKMMPYMVMGGALALTIYLLTKKG